LNRIPSEIKYLIYGLCGIIFITLNFGLGAKLLVGLTENLQKLTDYYFGISTNTFDYLTLASIPFFGMLFNATRKTKFKKIELMMDVLTILFCTLIIFGIGIYLLKFIGTPTNPLIPQYIITEPFKLYTTLCVGFGIVIPFLIVKLLRNIHERR
jgi:Na+/H+-dicarboxylate symporter